MPYDATPFWDAADAGGPPDATIWPWLDYEGGPPDAGSLSGATALALGGNMSCALVASGDAFCWGGGGLAIPASEGAGLIGPSNVPARMLATGPYTAITAGQAHACGLLASGTVECWGWNSSGQLGDGSETDSTIPVAVEGLTDVVSISAGSDYVCAVRGDGTAWCWGALPDATPLPQQVSFVTHAVAVASDKTTTLSSPCVLRRDGTVGCWGSAFSYIGNPSGWVTITGVSGATAITAGAGWYCALETGGSVQCWGSNAFDGLGDDAGQPASVTTPVSPSGLPPAVSISAGFDHTCAALTDGTVECWGDNQHSQCTAAGIATDLPTVTTGVSGATVVAAGFEVSCAVESGGAVQCWGTDDYGQLGNGAFAAGANPVQVLAPSTMAPFQPIPVPAPGVTNVVAAAGGSDFTCALQAGGTVVCAGLNGMGQLGVGSYSFPAGVQPVMGLTGASAIATGKDFACALVGGTVECWGDNETGQLGTTTSGADSTVPVAIPGVNDAVAISAGFAHACALLSDGTAVCWGDNSAGELGTGEAGGPAFSPTAVTVETGMRAIAAGNYATCGALLDGDVYCWGTGGYAGSSPYYPSGITPSLEPGLAGAVALSLPSEAAAVGAILPGGVVSVSAAPSAGYVHNGPNGFVEATCIAVGGDAELPLVCASFWDGTGACLGDNQFGEAGNASNGGPLFRLTGVRSVAAGVRHACAVLTNGTLWCWGDDSAGELFGYWPFP
jgi:alpha-tubulin suppressor-like RCC1 family protein